MTSRRRLVALLALFAVAFGALWPLVSAARPRSVEIPSFICTQSGFQHPGDPARHDDGFHCPLCVVGMESPPPVAVLAAIPVRAGFLAVPEGFVSAPRPSFFARPPPSRAPPRLS